MIGAIWKGLARLDNMVYHVGGNLGRHSGSRYGPTRPKEKVAVRPAQNFLLRPAIGSKGTRYESSSAIGTAQQLVARAFREGSPFAGGAEYM